MITLITGGPGTGKTAWLLDQLLDLRKNEPNRLIFVHGIRNLRGIQHEQIFCKSQLCDICRSQDHKIDDQTKFVENWPEWKEPGSLIVVDEVQRIWRPRVGGSQPSEGVSTLETHRHYGLDFWLISQGPHLFDNFIRLLVGRHVHLVAKWNGRTQYEWPECKQDVQSRSDAVIRGYTLPKRVYSMYDSAEVHTKQEKRKPLSLYVAIAGIILSISMFYFVGNRLYDRIHPENKEIMPVSINEESLAQPSPPANTVQTQEKAYPDFKPTIPGLAESAPAYRELIKVVSAPILKGCVATKNSCKCYTDQATVYQTNEAYCREYIHNNAFNPYYNPHTEETNQPEPQEKI